MAKQKILVTGANGQLGKELQRLSPGFPQYDFIFLSRKELPIDDFSAIRDSFRLYQPDCCINCAAYTAVDKAESERKTAFIINGEAPGVIAGICRETGCSLIHISTDYVFDGAAAEPYVEDAPTQPQSVYGESKLEGEKQVMHYYPGAIIIRTSWVYSEYGKNFVKTMLRLMSEREEIGVVNDQIGSPTYAADLAGAILRIVAAGPGSPSGIYHYANDGAISWFEFATAIRELAGYRCRINPIPTSQYPTPARRPQYSVLSKTKIQRSFGIEIKDWKSSLAICLQRLTPEPSNNQ